MAEKVFRPRPPKIEITETAKPKQNYGRKRNCFGLTTNRMRGLYRFYYLILPLKKAVSWASFAERWHNVPLQGQSRSGVWRSRTMRQIMKKETYYSSLPSSWHRILPYPPMTRIQTKTCVCHEVSSSMKLVVEEFWPNLRFLYLIKWYSMLCSKRWS